MKENPLSQSPTQETSNCATSTVTLPENQMLLTNGQYVVPLQKDWEAGPNPCTFYAQYTVTGPLAPTDVEYTRTLNMPPLECSLSDSIVRTVTCNSILPAPAGEKITEIALKLNTNEPGSGTMEVFDRSSNVTALGRVDVLQTNSYSYLPTIKTETTLFKWSPPNDNFITNPEAQFISTEIGLQAQEPLTATNQFTSTPPLYNPQIEIPTQ